MSPTETTGFPPTAFTTIHRGFSMTAVELIPKTDELPVPEGMPSVIHDEALEAFEGQLHKPPEPPPEARPRPRPDPFGYD
jgi:hypothetical protein